MTDYLGFNVLEVQPNRAKDPRRSFLRALTRMDAGTGKVSVQDRAGEVRVVGDGLDVVVYVREERLAAARLAELLITRGLGAIDRVMLAALALGLVAVLTELGFQVTSLLAGLGIGGLAFALAAQDISHITGLAERFGGPGGFRVEWMIGIELNQRRPGWDR